MDGGITLNATPTIKYSGYPIVGILPKLLKNDPYELFHQISNDYGDFVKLKIGPKSIYLVSNPDYLQRILRDNHKNYKKPDLLYKGVRATLGNGLVTSDGDFWLRQRRMMQPFFHRKFIGELMNTMIDAINEMLDQWEAYADSGEELDLYHQLAQITMNVITKTMFGKHISDEDRSAVAEDMTHIVDFVAIRGYLSFMPDWMPLPGKANFEIATRRQQKVIMEIIRNYRDNRSDDYNLINMLIHTVDEETNEQMTDQQLYDEAVTIFSAGFETTATMLTWLFHMLHELPHVHNNLLREVHQVLGGCTPDMENIRELTYSKMTIQETMRLRTVAPMLPRQAIAGDMLGDHKIPADAMMLMWFAGLHQHRSVWENPDMFDPERFALENSAGRSQFAYLPFGGGPRKCIGDEFAYMEGMLVLSMILQRYHICIVPNQDIRPKMSAVLRPSKPIKVKIERA